MTITRGAPGADWYLAEAEALRGSASGVGKRVFKDGFPVRFQSWGNGTVGLRLVLSDMPRLNTSIELVRTEVKLLEKGRYALDLVERSARAEDQSAAFFADIVQRLSGAREESVAAHIEAGLRHWKSVFAARRELLSDEQILGLFGELVILEDLLRGGFGTQAVEVWTGPEGEDHDFSVPGALEIECKTTAPHSERLRISNEHQLESGDVPLVLAYIRASIIRNETSGTSLPELVSRIEAQLPADGSVELFHQKLLEAGFDRLNERYRLIRIEHTETKFYAVGGDMPRIVPGDLRPGVSKVAYQIVISDLQEHEIESISVVMPFNDGADR